MLVQGVLFEGAMLTTGTVRQVLQSCLSGMLYRLMGVTVMFVQDVLSESVILNNMHYLMSVTVMLVQGMLYRLMGVTVMRVQGMLYRLMGVMIMLV